MFLLKLTLRYPIYSKAAPTKEIACFWKNAKRRNKTPKIMKEVLLEKVLIDSYFLLFVKKIFFYARIQRMKKSKKQKKKKANRSTCKKGGFWTNKCTQQQLYNNPSNFLRDCCYEKGKRGWKYNVFKDRESRCKSAEIINRFSREYKRSLSNLTQKLREQPKLQNKSRTEEKKHRVRSYRTNTPKQVKKSIQEERRRQSNLGLNQNNGEGRKETPEQNEEEVKQIQAEETTRPLQYFEQYSPKEGMIDYGKKMEVLLFDEYKEPYFNYLTEEQQIKIVGLFLRTFDDLNIENLVKLRNSIMDNDVLPIVQIEFPDLELKDLSSKQYFFYFEQLVVDAINERLKEMGKDIYIGEREGGSIKRKQKRQRQYHKKTKKQTRK